MIQELIKTMAQSQQIQSSTQREFKGQNLNISSLRGQGPLKDAFQMYKNVTTTTSRSAMLTPGRLVPPPSGAADRGGPPHQGRPTRTAPHHGEVHGHLPPHPVL